MRTCPVCVGGSVVVGYIAAIGDATNTRTGDGVVREPCRACRGTGKVTETEYRILAGRCPHCGKELP